MFRYKTIVVGSVFALVSLLMSVDVDADICDLCLVSSSTSPPGVLLACPRGDGPTLGSSGLTITITVRDCLGEPQAGIPATDIWLIGCNDLLVLCGGAAAINATGPTDAHGQTTIEGSFAAGGCDLGGVRVVVQGVVLPGPDCGVPCLPIKVKSCDIDGNLAVNLADFALFGAGYTSPPKPYNECIDYRAPFGSVDLSDFAGWGSHYIHAC